MLESNCSVQKLIDEISLLNTDMFMKNWSMHMRVLKLELDRSALSLTDVVNLQLNADSAHSPFVAAVVDVYAFEVFEVYPDSTDSLVLDEPFYEDELDKEFFEAYAPESLVRHNIYADRVLERV